jgi:hypothetical protein
MSSNLRAVRSLFLDRLTAEEQTALAGIWQKLGQTRPSVTENSGENHE